jgi:3-oxoacyl-[acyl-carrier-protein] synthase-1
MVTPLGFNAPASLAALRAGISGVRRVPWTDFEAGESLRGGKVALPQWWEGLGKLAELATPAVYECLRAAEPVQPGEIPILLGVADRGRPARVAGLEENLLSEIEHRLELPRHPQSAVFPHSQTGCVHALAKADRLLAEGRARLCVVAGVDSFLSQRTLDAYMKERRIMTASNSNGFFPGEAGCAVLVGPTNTRPDELRIIGSAVGSESATVGSTKPLRGEGMTQVVKAALTSAGVSLKDVAFRLTDLSGEHYKFKEALFASLRLNRGSRRDVLDLWHPIEYLGEVGAAILPCLLALARHAGQFGYAPGPLALCHVGSDDGQRAAFVLALPHSGEFDS